MSESQRAFVVTQFQQSSETPTRFFAAHADKISLACFEMAKRFARGGRLLVFGNGSSATDAQHVSVEFVHPVIVGKRALPAIALTNDVATLTGLNQRGVHGFAALLRLLGTKDDIALGLSTDSGDESVWRALAVAADIGMLTMGMLGMGSNEPEKQPLDFCFVIPSTNPHVVQEVQETLYHILWETVHVFFEHQGLL